MEIPAKDEFFLRMQIVRVRKMNAKDKPAINTGVFLLGNRGASDRGLTAYLH